MYERFITIPVDEIFNAIRNNKDVIIDNKIMQFGPRILTYFVHGTKCVCDGCKIEGTYFAAERQVDANGNPYKHATSYHLNFYGVDENNNEVMMTSDHKMPKSLGGNKNSLDNRQPMCYPHNMEKGNKLIYT